MFKNQYDSDVTTWSPHGRLHQVEYAMEAVKQGSATVGAVSETHAVVVALKRAPQAELSGYQPKIFKLDEHMGMSLAGLTSDARFLARFIRGECMNHRYVYNSALPIQRLVTQVADKSQKRTQQTSKRPFGVGLLVVGYDAAGPHLFQTCPSGHFYAWRAVAIGARSQSAKTYLERHYEAFAAAPVEDLVKHCLTALKSTCPDGVELNDQNTTIAIVSKEKGFVMYDDEEATQWVNLLKDSVVPMAEDQ